MAKSVKNEAMALVDHVAAMEKQIKKLTEAVNEKDLVIERQRQLIAKSRRAMELLRLEFRKAHLPYGNRAFTQSTRVMREADQWLN